MATCFVLLVLVLQVSPANVPIAGLSQSQSTTHQIAFQVNRDAAYYLGAIPRTDSQSILWFDWRVMVAETSTGTGSIQFSQDNLTWSNLLAFTLVSGLAQGRQDIDLSWARPGSNYLRASFNQSLSLIFDIVVFVNYYTTVLLLVSPFLVAIAIVSTVYLLRRSRKRPIAPIL